MSRLAVAAKLVYSAVVFGGWIVGPFLIAGFGWARGAWWLALTGLAIAGHQVAIRRGAPALVARRRTIGPGTPRWDLAWNFLFWPLMTLAPFLAALEARGGREPWPAVSTLLGALLVAGGFALSAWAMISNPHFEGTVRIQSDRGHSVVDRGPYATIRHPGYLGLAAWALSQPLLLGSALGLVGAAAAIGWLVLRTVKEDAFLRAGLPGYAEYAARVRARWVPGIF